MNDGLRAEDRILENQEGDQRQELQRYEGRTHDRRGHPPKPTDRRRYWAQGQFHEYEGHDSSEEDEKVHVDYRADKRQDRTLRERSENRGSRGHKAIAETDTISRGSPGEENPALLEESTPGG